MGTKEKINRRKRLLDSLKTWEREEKLKLIQDIRNSMREEAKDADFFDLAGSWEDSRSAEEITKDIEESRTMSGQHISL